MGLRRTYPCRLYRGRLSRAQRAGEDPMEVEVLRQLAVEEEEDLRGLESLEVEAVGFEWEGGDMPWGRVGFAVDP